MPQIHCMSHPADLASAAVFSEYRLTSVVSAVTLGCRERLGDPPTFVRPTPLVRRRRVRRSPREPPCTSAGSPPPRHLPRHYRTHAAPSRLPDDRHLPKGQRSEEHTSELQSPKD